MPQVKPLKVILKWRIRPVIAGLRSTPERAVYPDFPHLHYMQPALFDDYPRAGDFFGQKSIGGWQTNQQQNLGTGHSYGEAVILIPKLNCDGIVAATGYVGAEDVTSLTETELQSFWDGKIGVYDEPFIESTDLLQKIALKKQLGISLSPADYDALDPDTDTPGRLVNYHRSWVLFKEKYDISIVV